MTFKSLKTSVAIASAVGLALAGLTSVPASAAAGDVTIAPKGGTGTTVLSTDAFTFETKVKTSVSPNMLAYRIDNADQKQLHIDSNRATARIVGVKADGSTVDTGAGLNSGSDVTFAAGVVINFEALDIVSAIIYNLGGVATTGNELAIQLDESTTASSAAGQAVNPLEHGALVSSSQVTVTAWVENSAGAIDTLSRYLTVETDYSSSQVLSFVDPSTVSAVPRIERHIGSSAGQTNQLGNLTTRVKYVYIGTGDIESTTGAANPLDIGDTLNGETLAGGDRVLVINATTPALTGIHAVTAAGTISTAVDVNLTSDVVLVTDGTSAGQIFQGGADSAVLIGTIDLNGVTGVVDYAQVGGAVTTTDFETGDSFQSNTLVVGETILVQDSATAADGGVYTVAASVSATETDLANGAVLLVLKGTNAGKIATIVDADDMGLAASATVNSTTFGGFNNTGDAYLGFSLRFSNNNVNLAQVDLTKWDLQVDSTSTDSVVYGAGFVKTAVTPAGHDDLDSLGRLLMSVPVSDSALNKSATYNVKLRHVGATTVEYISSGYQVVASPSALANRVAATVSNTKDTNFGAASGGSYPVAVRYGAPALVWTAQVYSAAATKLEVANVPMLAVVTAGANFAAGETLTVSGTSEKVTTSSGTVVVSGLTNSKGEFPLTVTSSDTASASAVYDVQFYALDSTADAWLSTHESNTGSALYKVDYAPAVLGAGTLGFTGDTEVVSGSSVTVKFSVADQFGQALSQSPTAAAYSVELTAPDVKKLKLSATVVNGEASFTFENYLAAGGSDVLTAKLFTGASTSPSFVAGRTDNITLYNTNAIAGINAADEIAGVEVEFTDFFNGKVTGTMKAPGDGNKTPFAGTVVDSNGAGIPGAQVVISGTGVAFLVGTTYSVDTVTATADSAGAFSVDFWTHVANASGATLTATSGTATSSTLVKSALPTTMLAGNLKFSWSVPANPVFNTTYAVTATVKDVWGNPVSGAPITFTGLAAAQFNGSGTAQRNTSADGTSIVYLRSLKDVDGLAAVGAQLTAAPAAGVTTITGLATVITTDVANTSWDERTWSDTLEQTITFGTTAVVASADQKVNAGSFKGYVALYAKGYEGQRMSAKVGNDWVIVPAIPAATNDLFRAVEFVGAGVEISVRLYIDRVLVATIPLLTK